MNFLIRIAFITLLIFNSQSCIIKLFPDNMGKSPVLNERILQGTGKDKILVISIEGMISDERKENLFGIQKDSMISVINEQLKMAYKDSDIKGVILKINSPGGTVTASDIIYKEISNFKKLKNIPVHSLFMDVAASGAYYIAMASDSITSHPTCVTGSIGVVMQSLNFSEVMTKIGIKNQTVASGKNKTIGSPLEPQSKEHAEIMQAIIDDLYNRFFSIVASGRPAISRENLKKLADGRIYTANQAKANGLVDNIGYFQEAVNFLKNDAKYKKGIDGENPRIIHYTYSNDTNANIYNMKKPDFDFQFALPNRLSGFLYLWNPDAF